MRRNAGRQMSRDVIDGAYGTARFLSAHRRSDAEPIGRHSLYPQTRPNCNVRRLTGCLILLIFLLAAGSMTGCSKPDPSLTQSKPNGSQAAKTPTIAIPQYRSQTDTDGDGIDDQTDILDCAKAYVATKPQYASKYYAGGYPNDGYGVCTDVVAQALLGAGFDLHKLLNEDVKQHPGAYAIRTPDPNIDFRRVPNQNVYFKRHAISLTKDLSKIKQWQGGDIVVYRTHIGIVSDRRNQNGVPCLIHHYSSHQKNYEQNVLNWDKIVGHYRMSK